MPVPTEKTPINTGTLRSFAEMGCEEKPEEERAACYRPVLEDISKTQEQRKIIKTVTNGLIYLVAIGLVAFIFWLFFVKLRKMRKDGVTSDVMEEQARETISIMPMEPIANPQ